MSEGQHKSPDADFAKLLALGSLSGLGYAVLLWLSWSFTAEVPNSQRPTLVMLAIFGGEFAAYFWAISLIRQMQNSRLLIAFVLGTSCLFRAILLPSIPMHEIDIYRYLWDGAVIGEGVSPYRYPPQKVLEAAKEAKPVEDPFLQRLVRMQAGNASLSDSLGRIHYGQYPTPYPSVSQAVFALGAGLTPQAASTYQRMAIMKALLIGFDLATLGVVMLLLYATQLPLGLSLIFGWCPLLLKEIANSGHLDSIAIFLTTLSLLLLLRSLKSKPIYAVCAAAGLALAIGAKLYPVILLPLFAACWLRQRGWKIATLGTGSAAVLTVALLWPMLARPTVAELPSSVTEVPRLVNGQLNTPTPQEINSTAPDEGIRVFLSHWEMNDLLFMFTVENLRQQAEIPLHRRPWFVLMPDNWSKAIVTQWLKLQAHVGLISMENPPTEKQLRQGGFTLSRVAISGCFALWACWLAWRAAGSSDPPGWCRAAFLTFAWFWLSCPTQNPWYWCWAVPLLPFAKLRSWHAIAAMTMLYYLRFYLTGNHPEPPYLGTRYNGEYFFYFVVSWVEFLPVLIALAIEWKAGKR